MRGVKALFLLGGVLIIFLAPGCAFYNQTNPPRSATEQLLLSTSADRALTNVDLSMFAQQKIYLDTTYYDSYDPKYAIGAIRDALSRAGALLEPDAKSADVTVEARSGADSIDAASSLFGIPNMTLPIPFSGPMPIPELALYKSEKQHAIAKFALLAYANKSRAHIYSSGSLVGTSFNFYHKILFIYWITTDLPENKKKPEARDKLEVWRVYYQPENMPSTNAPATNAAPASILSTNAPAATNQPAGVPSVSRATNAPAAK